MKKSIFFLASIAICTFTNVISQSTYTSSQYAQVGDTLYLTSAQISTQNYDTTGANIIWDYSTLEGVSQRQLIFRTPGQTGVFWPYILNPANANLSSTNNHSFVLGQIQYTEPNDFFLKNTSILRQSASSSKVIIRSIPYTIKNQYTSPDVLLKFPVEYGNADSSEAAYATSIPNLYHRNTQIKRRNEVVGWGVIATPYGTFDNCLKIESMVIQIDSVVVDTFPPIIDTSYFSILSIIFV